MNQIFCSIRTRSPIVTRIFLRLFSYSPLCHAVPPPEGHRTHLCQSNLATYSHSLFSPSSDFVSDPAGLLVRAVCCSIFSRFSRTESNIALAFSRSFAGFSSSGTDSDSSRIRLASLSASSRSSLSRYRMWKLGST